MDERKLETLSTILPLSRSVLLVPEDVSSHVDVSTRAYKVSCPLLPSVQPAFVDKTLLAWPEPLDASESVDTAWHLQRSVVVASHPQQLIAHPLQPMSLLPWQQRLQHTYEKRPPVAGAWPRGWN